MEAESDLLRTAGQVPKQRTTSRARQRATQLFMLIVLVLGAIGFVAPTGAWADGGYAPTPAPSPDTVRQAGERQNVPIPTAQAAPTSDTPKIGNPADVTVADDHLAHPLRAGFVAMTHKDAVSPAARSGHQAVHHRLAVAGERGQFAQSLVYSGSAALVIAGSGLLLLGARRRLW